MANGCKYYTEQILTWMLHNKIIVVLSLLCFSLFVSTWALAAQKNRALATIDDLTAELSAATATTTVAPTVPVTLPTEAPDENAPETPTHPLGSRASTGKKVHGIKDVGDVNDETEGALIGGDENESLNNEEVKSGFDSISAVQTSRLLAALVA